ncbi:MAG: DUF4900 domain-containing protein [Candidatus Omnitrophota bacterium]
MKNKRGVALVISMSAMTIISALSAVYVTRAIQEKSMSALEINSAKVVYTAEAGANEGLLSIYNLINYYMLNTVSSTAPTTVSAQAASYATAKDGVGFLVTYVKNGSTALLTQSGGEAVYTSTYGALDGGSYVYTIRIGQKSDPTSPSANVWDFPYYFKLQTTATYSGMTKKTTLNGDFTVQVQKDNFARYSLFTNHQTMENGTKVWFTSKTNFQGPMFTNERFNFAYNPSGIFDGAVKQANTTAAFYNNGSTVYLDASSNGTRDVPVFTSGFQRGVSSISMPTSTQESDMVSEVTNGTTYSTNGIYVTNAAGSVTGGIYIRGNSTVAMGVDASNRQTLTIVQGTTTKVITLDRSANQTLVKQGATTTTYTGLPDGVHDAGVIVYNYGTITSLSGTVQGDTQMTIATSSDVVISGNVLYQNYTAGSGTVGDTDYIAPSASGYDNLLGLVSWSGDVRIASTAPSDVTICATLLAKTGVVQVDNYDSIAVRGVATILGGVISNYYGAFGTFNSSSGTAASGYGRNFVYDTRMEEMLTPPYFPTTNTFIAFTNNIGDHLAWQEGGF